jgi:branched-chain amino acid transport system permease protein
MDFFGILGLTIGELFSPFTIAYVLCALGLAMHFGFTGLLNFGQAAFAAMGAYGYSIAVLTFGWDWWAAVLFGVFGAVVFAVILGLPTLRLRADYLAIVTIAAAQAVYYALSASDFADVTGGSAGLHGFAESFYALNPFPAGRYNLGFTELSERGLFVTIIGWVIVILVALFMVALTRSPWGRVLKGIREDEDAVASLGKGVFALKMQSLIIGGVIAALGGIIFILAPENNSPSTWGTNFTFMIWTVLLLGGAATILGPVFGGMTFFALLMLTEGVMTGLVDLGAIPFLNTAQVAQIRYLLVGLALMLLVIFKPQGFLGNKKETQING